jgi:hypothetical protein
VGGFGYPADTGKGVEGAISKSRNNNSKAKILYLNDAGDGFDDGGASSNGIYVMVNPGLAEVFDVYKDGEKINITEGTAGGTSDIIFIIDIPIEVDEKL